MKVLYQFTDYWKHEHQQKRFRLSPTLRGLASSITWVMEAGGRIGLKGASSVPEGCCNLTFIIWRISRADIHAYWNWRVEHLPKWIRNSHHIDTGTVVSKKHSRFYLGHSSLQHNVPDGQWGCIECSCYHHQYIRSACWTVAGKMQQHTDSIFVICCHRTHLTLNTANKEEKQTVIPTEICRAHQQQLMFLHV